jgi:hypothetical protein
VSYFTLRIIIILMETIKHLYLNSEQGLTSIPMAQGGLSRLAIALPVAPLCSACGPGMVKKLKL